MAGLRVAHIADVHWRGLNRHDEFRLVFEAFVEEARARAVDVIHVGGDIFHTKTQNISPEVLECLDWWFTSLAEVAPLVVTLGNHDGNLMNRHRQDAITPIVKMLRNPRITLYKQSGVYPSGVPGFNWCVFSCFDEPGWEGVKPVPGDVNIALFHGSVGGSSTDGGFALEGDVSVDFFDGFDFAMLGDIHRMQHLATRTCADGVERPWVAYCGSTVQQNYGEAPEHGFLLWDIRSRDDFDVEFVELPNPSRFVTLDWAGDVDELVARARQFDGGVRFRVRSQGVIAQADWRRLARVLRRDLRAREVVPKVDRVDDVVTSGRRVALDTARDMRDPKVVAGMIREFGGEMTDGERRELDALVVRYVRDAAGVDDTTRNVRWSLEQLDFSNTFAYGEGNTINFGRLSGITGIFAGNAMGKSSIIGTMMYTLFNATDRGPMKNLHVINARKDSCEGRAVVVVDGVRHEIRRTSRKQTTGKGFQHAVTGLDFTVLDTGQSLNGEQRTTTERRVRQSIGTADDFMLTSLAVQDGLKAFIREGASQRKSILSRFLDLQVFEHIHEAAKQDSLSLKGRIRDMPERDWAAMRAKLDEESVACDGALSSLDDAVAAARAELSSCEVELRDAPPVPTTSDDVAAAEASLSRVRTRADELVASLSRAHRAADAARHRVEVVARVRSSFPVHELELKEAAADELRSWLTSVEGSLVAEEATLERKKLSVARLSDVPCGDMFPSCMYIRDSHADRDELPRLRGVVAELTDGIRERRTQLELLAADPALAKLERYRRVVARAPEYDLQLSRATHAATVVQGEVDAARRDVDRLQAALVDAQARLDAGPAAMRRRRLVERASELRAELVDLDVRRLAAAQRRGRASAALEQLERERVEFDDLTNRWRVYEKVIAATSKRGIPSQVLRQLVPIINDEVARILSGIVGFTVELELPEETSSMEVYIDYGDSRRIIELGSGMEKMVASIAIRVALINISSLPKTDMLVIDEGFSELDETNIEACGNLLRSLTRWFRSIVIITHIDSLKDVVDNVIDISRDGVDASVCYG